MNRRRHARDLADPIMAESPAISAPKGETSPAPFALPRISGLASIRTASSKRRNVMKRNPK